MADFKRPEEHKKLYLNISSNDGGDFRIKISSLLKPKKKERTDSPQGNYQQRYQAMIKQMVAADMDKMGISSMRVDQPSAPKKRP